MRFFVFLCIATACSTQVRAEGDWVDFYNSKSFVCRAEFRLDEYKDTLRELEQLKTNIEQTLQIKMQPADIQLNFFRNKRSYRRYLSVRLPEQMNRRALYVQGPDAARIYVYRHSECTDDLRHEYTHALLNSALPYLPLWLDEGLAEYFEVPQSKRDSGHSYMNKMRWAVRFGWSSPLKSLEEKGDLSEMGKGDYRNSWAIVHFLLHHSPQTQQTLVEYLNDIRSENPPGLFSKRLQDRIPNAEMLQRTHFKNWKS